MRHSRAACSRRQFLRGTGAAALPLLAACGLGPAAPKPEASTGPVKLTLWSHNNQPMVDVITKLIGDYRGVRPNVQIEYAAAPVQEHIDKLQIALAADSAPDGFNIIDSDFQLLNSKGWLAPVIPESFGVRTQQDVHNLYFSYWMTPFEDKGKVYGVPMNWAALSVFYNIKSVVEAGADPKKPFTDWESLTQLAFKLTERDGQGNVLKAGWQQNYGPATEWPVKRLYPMIYELGGAMIADNGKSAPLTSPQALEAIQTYTDWTVKYKVSVKGYTPPVQGLNPFYQGYRPLEAVGAYRIPAIMADTTTRFEYGRDYGVANWPQWAPGKNKKTLSPLWGWNWVVSAASKNKLATWSWFDWMTNAENDVAFQKGPGHVRIRRAGGSTPFPSDYPAEAVAIVLKDHENGMPVPRITRFEDVAQQLVAMLDRIETGQQQVKPAAEEAQGRIEDVLRAG